MKILVLNGSPKRDGSDTLCITRAFVEGMNETAAHACIRMICVRYWRKYCAPIC